MNFIQNSPSCLSNSVSDRFSSDVLGDIIIELLYSFALGLNILSLLNVVNIRFDLKLRYKALKPVLLVSAIGLEVDQSLYFEKIYRNLVEIQKIQRILHDRQII